MKNNDATIGDLLEDNEVVSYNKEADTFTITMLEDIEQMMEAYKTVPFVKKFVEREINLKKEYIHEIPRGNITGYEVIGFFWRHKGNEYTITNDYFPE